MTKETKPATVRVIDIDPKERVLVYNFMNRNRDDNRTGGYSREVAERLKSLYAKIKCGCEPDDKGIYLFSNLEGIPLKLKNSEWEELKNLLTHAIYDGMEEYTRTEQLLAKVNEAEKQTEGETASDVAHNMKG